MLLYVNACVREESRTRRLAEYLIGKLDMPVTEMRLDRLSFPVADEGFLKKRDMLVHSGDYSDPMFESARLFASADTVVIAAPYWDLSFPAALKQYFEQINVTGITFYYTAEGIPVSLCRCRRLFYVTTAGGPILSDEYGFGYVNALARGFYQIPDVRQIRAEGLDIYGADVEKILLRAEEQIDAILDGKD